VGVEPALGRPCRPLQGTWLSTLAVMESIDGGAGS
jgi:hypothetical protein